MTIRTCTRWLDRYCDFSTSRIIADVDVLPAGRLVAADRDEVLARLERVAASLLMRCST
jgi:hypothetical protein